MTNKTKRVLDYLALNPGATQHDLENIIMQSKVFSDLDYNLIYAKAIIETLVELRLISRRPGPQIGVDDKSLPTFELDTYYITETIAYRYGVAFGKTKAIPIECSECGTETFINPFSKLETPKRCRKCKNQLIPRRLIPDFEKEPGDGGFDMERSSELKANDIVVTCPLIQTGFINEKIQDPEGSFWNLSRKPKRLTEANRVFVLHDGYVKYNFGIAEIEDGPLDPVEDAEGHNSGVPDGGCRIWFSDLHVLKEPIKKKGFQGFRYRWW